MVNILVLGISGNVSQGILKALRLSQMSCKIIGACVKLHTAGDLWCDEVYQSPYAKDESFIPWLVNICNKEKIDIVLTGVEENLLAMAGNIEFLHNSCNSIFIVSDYEKLKIGQDKLLTCKWLEDNGFRCPDYVRSEDCEQVKDLVKMYGFPLILKPRHGKGSVGLRLVNNMKDLEECGRSEDCIVQTYIGDKNSEYTVGCYYDKKGVSRKPIIMHRWLTNGATWRAEIENNLKIQTTCIDICQKFAPMGPMNVQLRLDFNGEPVPFELNVRFSGTTPMRANFGFCDVEAVIREYILSESIDHCFSLREGEVLRYVNEAYVFYRESGVKVLVDKTMER